MHTILPRPIGRGKPVVTLISRRGGGGSGSGGSAGNLFGVGSPEGAATGDVGFTYVQTDTGRLWTKITGTATNTGWQKQPKSTVGTGDPNGAIVGSPGDMFYSTDLFTKYTKGSGSETNTGWI